MGHIAFVLLLLSSSALAQVHDIPDHARTPGALNADVTQENLQQTVCVVGWTDSIRPSKSYIRKLRREQMRELGQPGTASYHEDHIVPLCAGGHPSDARNLWPQRLRGKWNDNDKSQLERSVCRRLSRCDITLDAAQAIFLAPNWREEWVKFFPNSAPR